MNLIAALRRIRAICDKNDNVLEELREEMQEQVDLLERRRAAFERLRQESNRRIREANEVIRRLTNRINHYKVIV